MVGGSDSVVLVVTDEKVTPDVLVMAVRARAHTHTHTHTHICRRTTRPARMTAQSKHSQRSEKRSRCASPTESRTHGRRSCEGYSCSCRTSSASRSGGTRLLLFRLFLVCLSLFCLLLHFALSLFCLSFFYLLLHFPLSLVCLSFSSLALSHLPLSLHYLVISGGTRVLTFHFSLFVVLSFCCSPFSSLSLFCPSFSSLVLPLALSSLRLALLHRVISRPFSSPFMAHVESCEHLVHVGLAS
jgi:hypothetical protein